MTHHRVLILGGGFGGLLAAKALRRAPVHATLVDKRNFHLFQLLLYQVATGSLAPGQVAAPLRGILRKQKNTRVLLGEAVDLDPASRTVLLGDGDCIEYDSPIVATGSESSYFGNNEWRQWAPSLESMEEATAIRHKILYAFEAAERAKSPEERRAWLTFTIDGAGATGVELAGALAEIATRTPRRVLLHPARRGADPDPRRIFTRALRVSRRTVRGGRTGAYTSGRAHPKSHPGDSHRRRGRYVPATGRRRVPHHDANGFCGPEE